MHNVANKQINLNSWKSKHYTNNTIKKTDEGKYLQRQRSVDTRGESGRGSSYACLKWLANRGHNKKRDAAFHSQRTSPPSPEWRTLQKQGLPGARGAEREQRNTLAPPERPDTGCWGVTSIFLNRSTIFSCIGLLQYIHVLLLRVAPFDFIVQALAKI